jgi:hypothetical protein
VNHLSGLLVLLLLLPGYLLPLLISVLLLMKLVMAALQAPRYPAA